MDDILFTPLEFPYLTVPNRIMRSSMTGRFDHYNGDGTQTRINWDVKTAEGGVGAVVSAHVPVSIVGRIMPNVATLHHDNKIPFWKSLIKAVHHKGAKYIIQLSHAGRQRDLAGIENRTADGIAAGWSSTDKVDPIQGFASRSVTVEEIRQVVAEFGQAARRARDAGADGIETHSANGYLFTQFLSPAINRRSDEYGGSLENRARLLREVIQEIRRNVGPDFHIQVKLSAIGYGNLLNPFLRKGITLMETIQVARWCVDDGADGIVISAGELIPNPKMPPGDFPLTAARESFGTLVDSGAFALNNYLAIRTWPFYEIFRAWWRFRRGPEQSVEGMHVPAASVIKKVLPLTKVLVTGGFQRASVIRKILEEGHCDGVTIARPLIANPDLVNQFKAGVDAPERPCTFCNKCLIETLENPLGCYELSRFGGDYNRMIETIMEVYDGQSEWPTSGAQ
jgi:2,4-dienoyl-CoA reductase-like NADH-dependent reductase (Old Yellow Enzyme family)